MNFYSFIKTLAAEMLMPLPLCLGLLVVGLLLRNRWRRLGNGCALFALLLLGLFSWAPVADRLLAPFESAYPPLHDWPKGESVDAVMVLGGDYQPHQPWVLSGQLGDNSSNRLLEGLRLWHLNPAARLVVSGSSGHTGVTPIAQAYVSVAQDMQVPASQLHVLDTPTDTGKEALAAARLLGEGSSLLLVTSASHMPRAIQHFRQAGLNPIAAPTHYLALRDPPSSLSYWVPSASHLRKSERTFYEVLGLIAARWE